MPVKHDSKAVHSNCTKAEVSAQTEVGQVVPINPSAGSIHKRRKQILPAAFASFYAGILAKPASGKRQIIPCKFRENFIRVNGEAVWKRAAEAIGTVN